MVHGGDERGLALPPRIAPIQVIVVPIMPPSSEETVLNVARDVVERLETICRVELDSRDEYSPGWKFNEWELKGVPIRLEIGPRDVKAGKVVLVRRDTGEKTDVPMENLEDAVIDMLNSVQEGLYARAKRFMDENTHVTDDYGKFKAIIEEE